MTTDGAARTPPPNNGLRERKKQRTYDAIQRSALSLFLSQGYASTTMEEVAAAAEVSPSTVFRYFRSKADLVITDAWDDKVQASLLAQPAGMRFAEVFTKAMAESFVDLQPEDFRLFETRQRLIKEVPELRAAMLDLIVAGAAVIEDIIVARNLNGHPNPARLRVDAHALAAGAVGIIAVEALSSSAAFSPLGWGTITTSLERLSMGFDL
jgi:AcrR family transcriptional regulator